MDCCTYWSFNISFLKKSPIQQFDVTWARMLFFYYSQVNINLKNPFEYPYRRLYYVEWFINIFCVILPPLDFECLLNESLWLNKYINKIIGQSYNHYFTHNKITYNSNPYFISDVVTRWTLIDVHPNWDSWKSLNSKLNMMSW